MKKFFKAIRDKDFELVSQLINSSPELVNCTAKQPPKKDDGQSPLQIALKTGAFDIADFSYISPNVGLTVKAFYTKGSIAKLLSQVE